MKEQSGIWEVIVIINVIIEICMDIVEVFVDLWTNKIVGRFTKKKKSNPSSEIQ